MDIKPLTAFIGGSLHNTTKYLPEGNEFEYIDHIDYSMHLHIPFQYSYRHKYRLLIDVESGKPLLHPTRNIVYMVYMGCSQENTQSF